MKLKIIPKQLLTRKNLLVLSVCIVIIIATCLFFTHNNQKPATTSPKTNIIAGLSVNTDKTSSTQPATIVPPTSGPLQYELISSSFGPSGMPVFSYFTNESVDARLISLNDKILNELKVAKKIDSKTTAYTIDYFDNRTVADTYLNKINNPKTTATEKITMISNFVATMIHSTSPKMNQLIKMSDAKVLKSY